MILAHKIKLDPTSEQETYFRKAAGTARFTFNWGLAQWQDQYKDGQKPSAYGLKKQFNVIKKQAFPWVSDVTKCAPEGAFVNLGKAFTNFFAGRARYPRFKKRGVHDSFSLSNDQFRLRETAIKIPKLGWVKMTETLRFSGKILSAVVSRVADMWFVSIGVDAENPCEPCENQATVGVDVGIKTLATLSTGEVVENPKALRTYERRLKRLQRKLSKKTKGSKNRDKLKMRIARMHYRIRCLRQDVTHKLTTSLTQRFKVITVEDLNVAGMLKNHKLAKSISDANFSEIFRQLGYKSKLRENVLQQADRFYASSQLCSECGEKHPNLTLAVRIFECPSCGMVKDRDVNAACNLNNVGKAIPELTPGDKTALAMA